MTARSYSWKFLFIYLHRDQSIVFFPLQHMHIVVQQIHHVYMPANEKEHQNEDIQTESEARLTLHITPALLFVWWEVDAIWEVISLRDNFHSLRTVVHDVRPRLHQKSLHKKFKEAMGKVVIVGCVEGFRSHCNNIIHTGDIDQKKNKNKK